MWIRFLCMVSCLSLCSVSPTWALQSVSEFLGTADQSPFEMSISELKARLQSMRELVDHEQLGLARLESDLELKFNAIISSGYNANKFMAEYSDLTERLPETLKKDLQRGIKIDESAWIERSSEFKALYEFTDTATQVVQPFVNDLDSYNIRTMDAAMISGLLHLYDQVLTIRENGTNPDALSKLNKLFSKLNDRRKAYLENRSHYGQPKGSFVLGPSNTFLGLLKALSIKIQKHIPGKPEVIEKENRSFWDRLSLFFRRIPLGIQLIYSAAKARSALWNLKPANDKTNPFTKSILSVFRQYGEILGVEVEKIGIENVVHAPQKPTVLSRSKNALLKGYRSLGEVFGFDMGTVKTVKQQRLLAENEVLIINPTHRDSLMDFVALANIYSDRLVFFGAAPNFIPNMIPGRIGPIAFNKGEPIDVTKLKRKAIDLLNRSDSFIVVGKGKDNLTPVDPNQKFLDLVRQGKKVFVLFSEGMLPSELGAISPIQEKSFELTKLLRDAGYRPIISGMSFKNNHDPFDLNLNRKDSKRLEVEIFPPIPDHLSGGLMALGGTRALSLLYRFGAISSMITNENLLFGQVRATQLEGVIRRHMRLRPSMPPLRSCLALLGR